MDILEPADWTFPVPVHYGPGRIAELSTICVAAAMTAPMVVTDRNSAHLPFIGSALDALRGAGMRADLFAEISPNPLDVEILAGRDAFRRGRHDGVVAIGGGSGMDGGKAISLVANNEVPLGDFSFGVDGGPRVSAEGLMPVVCVPTTAGTGAETESTAMVTDTTRGVKICVWHAEHHPVAALLDPELTVGLPPHLTAWTGVDALVHAIEAYSVDVWHPMCDALALEAIRLIWRSLPRAVADGADLEARASMLVGSCLAGVSFLKGLGLVHAMSHMVGAVYDTHHGLTNAVLLPPVLEFNEPVLGDRVPTMAGAMGLESTDFAAFFASIESMLHQLEIPTGLGALGVEPQRLDELAQKALGDSAAATNPRSATVEQIVELLSGRL